MLGNMCLHCLNEGDWTDEDKCPACAAKGHTSPWEVSKCPVCNKEFQDALAKINQKIDTRIITELVERVAKLEKQMDIVRGLL